jgi:ABC-type multidrug transport system permease subunit
MADGFQATSIIVVTLLIIGAIVVLGRAGYWSLGLPFSVFRWGIWVFVVIATLSTLANFASLSDWEQFMDGAIALLLAVLCLIVARSVVSPH